MSSLPPPGTTPCAPSLRRNTGPCGRRSWQTAPTSPIRRRRWPYQAGCCALSGGGLFAGETEDGPVCACAEGDGAGLVVYKELLGTKLRTVLPHLPRMVPGERFLVRGPLAQRPAASGGWQFGMLKWLSPDREEAWDWSRTAYLGLAFD